MSRARLVVAAVALPLLAQPPAPLEPKDLRWRAPLEVAAPVEYALVEVRQPMYARTDARFQDLRIFGPDGAPVAWMWHATPLSRSIPGPDLKGELLDRVLTPGGALRFVVPAGRQRGMHSALFLDTDEETFQRDVTVETGNDLTNWSLAARGTILRLRVDGQLLESLRVSYPQSTQRYLRVTVAGWAERARLTRVEVQTGQTIKEEWTTLGSAERPRREAMEGRVSRWNASFEYGWLERARLTIETPSERFARRVEVRTSANGENWTGAGEGMLYRAGESERLHLELTGIYPRHLRIETRDGDNTPLELGALALEAPVRWIVFPARTAGRYWLYLGRADAVMPDYDLPAVVSRAGPLEFVTHAAGDWQSNPDYVAPPEPEKPVSERIPWLLPGVLGVAVLAMGAAAWRLLRKAA